jgi:hypothetical protein
MIRRFEIYSVDPQSSAQSVSALETACRRCGQFIPDVLHDAVGWNRSEAPVDLVWEHAFDSPAAYRRYMVHPYHAAVLDRYILHDSPERVVTDNDLGAGLVGYACDGPVFAMTAGVRRLVLLRVDRNASPDAVARLVATLTNAPGEAGELVLSVVGANTLGSAWFDAVTSVAGPPRWTHLWEQGFVTIAALDAYLDGPSSAAAAERRQWQGAMDGIVARAISVHYEIDAPPKRGPRPRPGQSGGPGVGEGDRPGQIEGDGEAGGVERAGHRGGGIPERLDDVPELLRDAAQQRHRPLQHFGEGGQRP